MSTTAVAARLPPLPDRIAQLPRDDRGYPVPFFVLWTALESDRPTPAGEGRPRFPIMDGAKWERAVRERRCWVCGQPLGVRKTFVIGPMCTINRVSAEPPCHYECAEFAARACPFLIRPRMKRMPLPDEAVAPPGIHLDHNPGALCVWTTKSFRVLNTNRGPLIEIGPPDGWLWFAEGKPADRATVKAAVNRGLPELRALAAQDGIAATTELNRQITAAQRYLPKY